MTPYVFTVIFLMIMSFLTSIEAIRFSQSSIEKKCYENSRKYLVATEEVRELTHYQKFRDEKNTSEPRKKPPKKELNKAKTYVPKAKALGVDGARPPNNSRINFYLLLHKEPSKELPKHFSFYEITAELMRLLYREEPFFQTIPGVEYLILDKLFEKKAETLTFTLPDQLSTISLEDDALQKIFYHMLTGTKTANSLLNYLTFDHNTSQKQDRKINLLFVDPLIIHAIFPQKSTAAKLIARRDLIWKEIEDREKHLSELTDAKGKGFFSKKLKEALEDVLSSDGINPKGYKSQVFDCILEKPGNVIFLEDPHTGHLIREIYIEN